MKKIRELILEFLQLDLKEKIEELKAQGMSLRAIAESLGVSLGKVQRALKK